MSDYHEIKSLIDQSDARVFERIDAIQSQVKDVESELLTLQQKGAVGGLTPQTKGNKSITATLRESDGLRALKNGARSSGQIDLGMSIKALTSLQGSTASPAAGIDVQSERAQGLYGYAMRPLSLFDVMPVRSIASNSLTFTQMQSFSNAAAGQAGEGVEKAEQNIDPDLKSAPIETIAVWHDASNQVLDDEPGLEQSITMLLMHGVQEKAERQIISGAGGGFTISGLTNEGTTFVPSVAPMADRIGECQATMANSGYQPDLVILNPVDWFTIRSERAVSGDEQYVGPGWNAPATPSIYGVRTIASPAVAQGTAIVVDTRFVSLLDRMQPTVEFSRETGNNFKANLTTILAELRVGLAVFDPLAVQTIDLTGTV